MAIYTDAMFSEPPSAFPTTGIHLVRIKHVTQAAYVAGADSVKLYKLPKGASIIAEQCSIFANSVDDPSGGAMTLNMKITDGTTTKTIVTAGAIAAVNDRVVASAADIGTLTFFKTSNNDFYVYTEVAGAAATAAKPVYFVIAYTMDGGRSEVTT